MGHEGFTGTSSLLYHTYPPTTVKRVRRLREIKCEADPTTDAAAPALPDLAGEAGGSPTLDRIPLLFNRTSRCCTSSPTRTTRTSTGTRRPTSWCTSAKGTGVLETVFGDLPYREGDYLVIHRGILHRWRLDLSAEPTKLLVIESRGHVRWPKRYRNEFGQLIEGAPY